MEVIGPQWSQYRAADFGSGTVFDARTATWSGRDRSGTPIPWTVTFRGGDAGRDACWVGGHITGAWDDTDPSNSWEDPYHRSGGMTIDVPSFLVVGVRIDGQGDGIRTVDGGRDATIRAVHLSDIHDDCVENDDLHDIVIEDSFLDGCYTAFSARPYTSTFPDRSHNRFVVRNSLVRLEPQPTVYRGASPGHGGFFKWDAAGRSPALSLHDTVLRADQAPNHGVLDIPDRIELASCSGNVLVWLGPGPFPGELPPCIRLTTDRGYWDDAVADWHRRHG